MKATKLDAKYMEKRCLVSIKHCEVNDDCGNCQKLVECAGGMSSLVSLSSAPSLSSCPLPLSEMGAWAGSVST